MALDGAETTVIAQDEILTGEAVALDVQPVGFLLRAVGAVIDVAVSTAILVLFALAMLWLAGNGSVDEAVLPILVIAMIVVVTVVVPTLVETTTRGRSLGKLAVGGRVVRIDGGAAGFRHAFIRALVGVLEIWLTAGVVAALVGVFTVRGQRLGDLVAGTYAERTRAARLPAVMPQVPPSLMGWAEVADVAALPDPLARRLGVFVRQGEQLEPAARQRLAASLAVEAAPFVSPLPTTDPELFIRGVAAVRFAREYAAVQARDARAAALVR
ncbi:MAG: RDD family protein [Microbacterium sp.]|uniref:RDD family protein n=1 Tax=Microbacterium sp. TaxID=51671 RepID=UPI002605642C|nr:RDD family protein [Microbacterium sp.]MCX6501885.1 RDD family protein [Microbacterium sp.]